MRPLHLWQRITSVFLFAVLSWIAIIFPFPHLVVYLFDAIFLPWIQQIDFLLTGARTDPNRFDIFYNAKPLEIITLKKVDISAPISFFRNQICRITFYCFFRQKIKKIKAK